MCVRACVHVTKTNLVKLTNFKFANFVCLGAEHFPFIKSCLVVRMPNTDPKATDVDVTIVVVAAVKNGLWHHVSRIVRGCPLHEDSTSSCTPY